ncbi:TPA: ead/Ea22-like family protein [Escherichia coli]
MSKIDYEALRAKAEKATCGVWSLEYGESRFDCDDALIHREAAGYIPICRIEGAHPESGFDEDFQMEQQANAEFIAAASPATVLALLDERERNQQYIKRRDQENEEIALTVGKLRVELEAAENNLIDSECHVAELEEALRDKQALLEASEKRIAELEAELVSQTCKLNELSGNYPVTPDGWISCSERMPVIGELNWRTSFPLLITCEIGVIPAYYGFVRVNGNEHYGFMESLKYGDDNGNHPQTNEYGLISNVTHWMPLPEPPQEVK